LAPPRWTSRQGAVARLRHRRVSLGCLHHQSRPFARSGKGRVNEAIRLRQLRSIPVRRTSRPAPLQRRGCELALGLLGPRRAFTIPRRPLTFPLSPEGTPESDSVSARCAARGMLSFRIACPEVLPPGRRIPYCRSREGLAAGNPRTPSVVSRTCKPKPAGRDHVNLVGDVNPRTVSPSLHPCSASGGALGLPSG
jgi:hypothetical protein